MTNWPKHPDGRNKKMGEMTREEQKSIVAASCKRLQTEFDRPEVKEHIAHILKGGAIQ